MLQMGRYGACGSKVVMSVGLELLKESSTDSVSEELIDNEIFAPILSKTRTGISDF